ncbi:MAG: RidA family protein [Candidatus Cyclobacteriaceae bacterium M2_1C_046]
MRSLVSLIFSLCILTAHAQSTEEIENKLQELNIKLPEMSEPVANYTKYVHTGNLIFLSGHGPCGGEFKRGKLGNDLTIEEGYAAARLTGVCLLSTLKHAINGDWSRVKRIVKVTGMVSSSPDFTDQPKVINGCSDLLTEVFGKKGKHARAAVGMASLPSDIPVEIEMIVEVE